MTINAQSLDHWLQCIVMGKFACQIATIIQEEDLETNDLMQEILQFTQQMLCKANHLAALVIVSFIHSVLIWKLQGLRYDKTFNLAESFKDVIVR